MAKDKERSINPAQAQRKAEKAKALKKSRNEQQIKRNEKLARRNPDRIQRQIDDLKALETSGEIKAREKAILADLERDLKAVRKAKEAVGDTGATHAGSSHNRQSYTRARGERDERHGVLGKRRHDGQRKPHEDRFSSGSDTDESVRNIPMPRDTPPPAPRFNRTTGHPSTAPNQDTDVPRHLPPKPMPVFESKTTYSSAPQMRDLKKEATSRFVPDIVRRKQDAVRGHGGLLEPEELDQLEKEGYYKRETAAQSVMSENPPSTEHAADTLAINARRLEDEEARFERELAESMDVDVDENVTNGSNDKFGQENADQRQGTGENDDLHISAQNKPVEVQAQRISMDEDEDEDEDDYLPPLMSGRVAPTTKPPQITPVSRHDTSIAAGLFSKLPKPNNDRHVQIEDVEDEEG